MEKLAFLYGEPTATGDLRSFPEDFCVSEIIPFELSGEGEHLYIHIQKRNTNTNYVVKMLAKHFGIKEKLVSYAGLKDRNAVTEQWFSVHLPGVKNVELSSLNSDQIKVLAHTWHAKKLKTGALSGNRFELILRNVSDIESLKERWQKVCESGVPNYFGEQRFGHDGNNLKSALAMFNGRRVKDRSKKSIYLSAARSYLFNLQLSDRIDAGLFNEVMSGDVMMLSGSQSIFSVEDLDAELINRHRSFDIDITASMWGAGELKSKGDVAQREAKVVSPHKDITAGLAKFGLKQERRRIRLQVGEPSLSIEGNVCKLNFVLPAGCFATSVLRELGCFTDVSSLKIQDKEQIQ